MNLNQDLRSVLHPRSDVSLTEQRLIDAAEHAAPITLSLQEISTLLTFMAAARRVAEAAVRQKPEVQETRAKVASLQYQLAQSDQAWETAERRIWQLETGANA